MSPSPIRLLFLCTHNSARSIMAEAILNHLAHQNWIGYSAGSHPSGVINPLALEVLERNEVPTKMLHSKNWLEFAQPEAPVMDLVVTVCDQAAGEMCPIWPGGPLKAHWGLPEPGARAAGLSHEEGVAIFQEIFNTLHLRLQRLVNLPLETLSLREIRDEIHLLNGSEG
ncbi:MAG: arsenate reductase ArsC [Magnetococcales bacterium]|nr:arsenate reductase ArsC [Magnetococcales bacterium]NGZ25869.1 arsenate reductase ArsC [Magnetococcales bacterium]